MWPMRGVGGIWQLCGRASVHHGGNIACSLYLEVDLNNALFEEKVAKTSTEAPPVE